MALKAVHVSDIPATRFDKVPDDAAAALNRSTAAVFSQGANDVTVRSGKKDFLVMGHRGSGMNLMQSPDRRMKFVKENSVASFNAAAKFPIDFIEFDVQVTKDDCPVIFHDTVILTQSSGQVIEKRVTELTLEEFLSYGRQRDSDHELGLPLLRKTKDGRIFEWIVEEDAPFCTLQEAFEKVNRSVGFNIELKFDDHIEYSEGDLTRVLGVVLRVVYEYAKDRPIMFSSFHPDAALLIQKLQRKYPVFFLTNGGSEIFADTRRNSLDEAIKVCVAGGLQGIVSEVKAVFRNPNAITQIKDSDLSIFTYGQLNNVPEVVYMQRLMGVEGVIVDLVPEITKAVSDFMDQIEEKEDEAKCLDGIIENKGELEGKNKLSFSQNELSFLLKLIPELIRS